MTDNDFSFSQLEVTNGEPPSFEIIFKKNFPRLKKYSLGMVRDYEVAEDLVQDAFIKLWEKRNELHSVDSIQGLLYTIVRNNCLNYLKKNKMREQYVEAFRFESPTQELFIRSFLEEEELKEERLRFQNELERVLTILPDKCREVFELSRFEGLTNKEVAVFMGVTVKTVEKHLAKATKLHREALKKGPKSSLMQVWLVGF